VPLFMLWFGIGLNSKLALVISVVAFLVFYATYAGVKDVDHHLVDKMRLMRAKRWHVHAKVTVPSAMSFIIQGLGVSAPYALVVAVAAEMLASNRGLGYLLVNASTQFDTAGTFAIIFVLMLLGIVLMALINLLERRLLRWKPKRPVDRH
jgi:NitT/TauT family transport system permease protein